MGSGDAPRETPAGGPGGAEQAGQEAGQAAGAPPADLSTFDQAINDLHGRIAELRVDIDDISHPRAQGAAPPPAAPPPPAPYPPPTTPPEPPPMYAEPSPYGDPAVPPPYQPPPAYAEPVYGEPAYGEQTYAEPAAQDPYATAYAPAPLPQDSVPAEAYSESFAPVEPMPGERSDVPGTFARVDVGPFEDLLAMTAFEEQLSALNAMDDVRVRRFGAGRAEIEVVMAPGTPLAREIRRVAPDADTVLQPDGTLAVELHAERWLGQPEAPPAAEELVEGAQYETLDESGEHA